MSSWFIENVTVVLDDRLLGGQSVLLKDGKIASLAPAGQAAPAGATVVSGAGMLLAPGYIDLHVHGMHEHLIDNGPDQLAGFLKVIPQYGVTGVTPCMCPLPKGEDAKFLSGLAAVRSEGAEILGFHLEGPFLSLTGALPAEAIGQADEQRVQGLIEAAGPYPAIFSVAPDFKDIVPLIGVMSRGGKLPVFMTHTAATVEQTQAAIEAGVRHATHFYDVYPMPAERDPGVRPCGVVEAVLADPRVSVDFILDGEHVEPIAVKMALQCKGPDRVCLITDANVGAGMPPGRYKFLGNDVEFAYPGAPARFTKDHKTFPGALAGSGLTLDCAVRNAVKLLGVSVPQAVRMASANPAQVLRVDGRKGRIREGMDADVLLLDEALNVKATWVGGRKVYGG